MIYATKKLLPTCRGFTGEHTPEFATTRLDSIPCPPTTLQDARVFSDAPGDSQLTSARDVHARTANTSLPRHLFHCIKAVLELVNGLLLLQRVERQLLDFLKQPTG